MLYSLIFLSWLLLTQGLDQDHSYFNPLSEGSESLLVSHDQDQEYSYLTPTDGYSSDRTPVDCLVESKCGPCNKECDGGRAFCTYQIDTPPR